MSARRISADVVTITLNAALDRTVTIRDFAAGAVNRVEQVDERAGGKGINVAAALADYGHRVTALGFLGKENAAEFEAFFETRKIADHCVRLPGRTRTGIKIVDPTRKQTTDINFPGLAPTASNLAGLRTEIGKCDAQWAVVAGSLPLSVEPEFYREIIGALKARGVRVALDTSGAPLRCAVAAVPHFIKPNVHELEELVGKKLKSEAAVIAAARALVAKGIGLVVVSRGSVGACFVTADEVVVARAPEIEVNSTVGAGDAMVAGIVAAQLAGMPLAKCARLATGFALHTLTRGQDRAGAREKIAAWAARVKIL